jgi:hydrogenase/urease accessory protein HupE
MSWWIPFAFIGAAIVGIVIAYSLTAGRPRPSDPTPEAFTPHDRQRSRYQQDNELVWNPAAFVALAGLVGVLILIAVLIEAV